VLSAPWKSFASELHVTGALLLSLFSISFPFPAKGGRFRHLGNYMKMKMKLVIKPFARVRYLYKLLARRLSTVDAKQIFHRDES